MSTLVAEKKKPLTTHLTADERKQLKSVAKSEGRSQSSQAAIYIRQGLKQSTR